MTYTPTPEVTDFLDLINKKHPTFGDNLLYNYRTGCFCIQGYLLHKKLDKSVSDLDAMDQSYADQLVADYLGISTIHAVLLRQVNDQPPTPFTPNDVLANPEVILGPNWKLILDFWLWFEAGNVSTPPPLSVIKAGQQQLDQYWGARSLEALLSTVSFPSWLKWATIELCYLDQMLADGLKPVILEGTGFQWEIAE